MGYLMTELGLSGRRSCRIVGLSRLVQQYRPTPKYDDAMVERLKELASENRHYGYLRLHAVLRREGQVVNRERTYRLYTDGPPGADKEATQAAAPGSVRAAGA
ncbi:IS3 family transposase [Roseitranquillus sediminis]|uniref:IS3 family transposase n=1 Tax=Roseitranquillus sediminis TaxID=2809051 RepID=UPI001D0CCEDA|nr:IS3 family transposase [Roseitranquillus sediminis]MBM9595650.1 transposase [Roseitranquillus sediminis]